MTQTNRMHLYLILLTLLSLSLCTPGLVVQERRSEQKQKLKPSVPPPDNLSGAKTGETNPGEQNQASEEEKAAQNIEDEQPTGEDAIETGIPPKYPLRVVSVEAQAHDSQVSGCRDHPNTTVICQKAENPCFCEEHETYMYSYCRRSCRYCDPETAKYHRIWRLRANATYVPSWIISEIEMYNEVNDNISLSINATSAFASSEYPGYHAFNAFDLNGNTTWMPDGWIEHKAGDDWIAYQFPIPVKITAIKLSGLPEEPSATPARINIEAADSELGPFHYKWTIYRTQELTQVSSIQQCPVLWRKFDNKGSPYCYRLIAKFLSWSDALDFCEQEDSSLLSIANEEEQEFVLDTVKLNGFVWIGMNDQKTEGSYSWTDNLHSNYTNWKKGESYDEVQMHYEDCTTMDREGSWFMANCANKNFFICKKKLPKRPPAIPPNDPPAEPPFIFLAPHITKPVVADEEELKPGEDEAEEVEDVKEIYTDTAIQHMKEAGLQPPQIIVNSEDPNSNAAEQLSAMVEAVENETRLTEQSGRNSSNKGQGSQSSSYKGKTGNGDVVISLGSSNSSSKAPNSTYSQNSMSTYPKVGELAPPSTAISSGPSIQQQNKQSQVDPLIAQVLGLNVTDEAGNSVIQPSATPPQEGPLNAEQPGTVPENVPKRPPPYPAPLPPLNETVVGEDAATAQNAPVPQEINAKGNAEEVNGDNEGDKEEAKSSPDKEESNSGKDESSENSDGKGKDEKDEQVSIPNDKKKPPKGAEETKEDTPDVSPSKPGEGVDLPEDQNNDDDEMGEAGEEDGVDSNKDNQDTPTPKAPTTAPTEKRGNDINDKEDDVHPPSQGATQVHREGSRRAHDTTQGRRERHRQQQSDTLREKWKGFKSYDREKKKRSGKVKRRKSQTKRRKIKSKPNYRANDYFTNRQMLPSPDESGYFQQPIMDMSYNPGPYANGFPYPHPSQNSEEELPDWSEANFADERGEYIRDSNL